MVGAAPLNFIPLKRRAGGSTDDVARPRVRTQHSQRKRSSEVRSSAAFWAMLQSTVSKLQRNPDSYSKLPLQKLPLRESGVSNPLPKKIVQGVFALCRKKAFRGLDLAGRVLRAPKNPPTKRKKKRQRFPYGRIPQTLRQHSRAAVKLLMRSCCNTCASTCDRPP